MLYTPKEINLLTSIIEYYEATLEHKKITRERVKYFMQSINENCSLNENVEENADVLNIKNIITTISSQNELNDSEKKTLYNAYKLFHADLQSNKDNIIPNSELKDFHLALEGIDDLIKKIVFVHNHTNDPNNSILALRHRYNNHHKKNEPI